MEVILGSIAAWFILDRLDVATLLVVMRFVQRIRFAAMFGGMKLVLKRHLTVTHALVRCLVEINVLANVARHTLDQIAGMPRVAIQCVPWIRSAVRQFGTQSVLKALV